MRTRTITMPAEFRPTLDESKITLKFWKHRLCCWPGSVVRWLQRDDWDEFSVKAMPGVGYVPCTRLEFGMAERVLNAIHATPPVRGGMPLVLNRSQLPDFVRELV